jgi:hypothetical protein
LAEHSAGAVSVFGAWIRFPEERWQHILREHPELENMYEDVLTTIESPSRVLAGTGGELLAAREISPGKFLVVVYKELGSDDGFVITAFLTRRIGQLERRTTVWPRQ